MRKSILFLLLAAAGAATVQFAAAAQQRNDPGYDVAEMYKMHFTKVNTEFSTAAQPTLDELARLKAEGYKAIINLRTPREHDAAAEEARAKELGLRYFNIPVVYMDPKDEQVDEFLKLTDDPKNRPVLIHCTMAIRVSAFWMIRRVLRDAWSVDKAEEEAVRLGLSAQHLKKFARDYIESHAKGQTGAAGSMPIRREDGR